MTMLLWLFSQMTPSATAEAYTAMADQGVILVLNDNENCGVEQSGSSPDSFSGDSRFKSWPRKFYLWRNRYVW